MSNPTPNQLVEHFFRHESGKMLASLVHFFGVRHFDLVEDTVQATLADALRAWKIQGVPENPAGWIHRVAKNKVVDALRRNRTFAEKTSEWARLAPGSRESVLVELFEERHLQDNLLRMIFTCCHPSLPPDSRIPLTLKTICGFSEREIARGLLLTDETVRKRIYRARQSMIDQNVSMELPENDQLLKRLDSVHNVLYLMFNEGYCSSHNDQAIRLDLCEEAARVCHLLTESEKGHSKDSFALLALMLFHACRFRSRIDQEGALVLLEDQDRRLWDRRMMARAFEYFSLASGDCRPSGYHFEAAIAMNHCQAARFEETNWTAIVLLYDRLIALQPSPIYKLNRAIAIGQKEGPDAGLRSLDEIKSEPLLLRSHLLESSYGELHRMRGDRDLAARYFRAAIEKAEAPHDQTVLKRRLAQCQA